MTTYNDPSQGIEIDLDDLEVYIPEPRTTKAPTKASTKKAIKTEETATKTIEAANTESVGLMKEISKEDQLNPDVIKQLSKEFNISEKIINTIKELLAEDNTIHFIARYRKEQTGNIEPEVLYDLSDRLTYLTNLMARKATIKTQMASRNQLTPELEARIDQITIASHLEDLYKPFIPRVDTPGEIARGHGFGDIADAVLANKSDEELLALYKVYCEEYQSEDWVIDMNVDVIIAEEIAMSEELKRIAKDQTLKNSKVYSVGTNQMDLETSEYANYVNYSEDINTIPEYRLLAMFRGRKEKELTINVTAPDNLIISLARNKIIPKKEDSNTMAYNYMYRGVSRAYEETVKGEVDTEIKKELQEKAEARAAQVFANNLKSALMQSPVKDKVIMALDPGYAHGCKLAVINTNGGLLDTAVIYPHPPQRKTKQAEAKLVDFITKYGVDVVAIGNGTAGRESEILLDELIKENELDTKYIMVNEAGASVYSASKEAMSEFPGMDTNVISAISIARRLLDPMAELVKIDPKSLGLGQYQHDITKKVLEQELKRATETVVNTVGVDVNTASKELLANVSGLTQTTANIIFNYREQKGRINSRKEIETIPGLTSHAVQQSIGFLKVFGSPEPLDELFIHPEDYAIARDLLELQA